ADRNRSHWSTSKTPSYTKSVSWQHHHQIATNSEQVFHFAARFQKVGNGESGVASGLYAAKVSVTAAYE
ncbi:hypothetical protein RZO68_21130, partial [Citrobacter freundii]|nr:hypothetical protein [Citrobacter freundii]MDV0490617.1 hypothetical protein [Citrobacter freundii]MDV0495673.1 hypothetical protein [Citrobacter freundii]MDV0500600.1 hypothetical protein [Citrobacter freundii]MDV0505622.1 hypothetical protein [Citrobacter freundii]